MTLWRPLACSLALLGALHAQTVSTESPFVGMPVGGATQTQSAGDYEFVGVLGADSQARFGFVKKSTQKSFWLELGREAEGLKLLRREGPDQVLVQSGSYTWPLKLRAPTVSQAPTVVFTPQPPPTVPGVKPPSAQPAPTTAPVYKDPVTEEKEREARMLVSDLLEIGMQQRKAYEEAQKKKAAETAAKSGASTR